MLEALTETKRDASTFLYPLKVRDGQLFPQNLTSTSFSDVDFITDVDNNLETLKEFQQHFVSNQFAPI